MSDERAQASGTFDIDSWDESEVEETAGARFSRVLAGKIYHGDIEGRTTTTLLMALTRPGPGGYVGIEHLTVTLQGRQGSFALQHHAPIGPGDDPSAGIASVVPDSGTDGLSGLRGELRILIEDGGVHRWTLTYELSGQG
ncbi:MAG TPA: DUF3224 domain-containing protein [Candidatus Dormibacteraeota bacterium]|nr:DUF3224 domain-containing protein [Candidatus Dormibacteraeota bacterium]